MTVINPMINKTLIIVCLLLLLPGKSYSSENKFFINLHKSSGNNIQGFDNNSVNGRDEKILKQVQDDRLGLFQDNRLGLFQDDKLGLFQDDRLGLFQGGMGAADINILAIRVEFKEDSIDTAHGVGLFELASDTSVHIDPPPHNRTFFEDHLEALKRYYYKVSSGRINISYKVFPEGLNESYKLSKEMKYYSPNTTKEELNARLCELLSDSFLEADRDPAIDFSEYKSFMVFHAGVGADFSVNPYYDPYPNDIPSVFLSFNDLISNLGNNSSAYKGIPVNEGQFFIKDGIILPETENRIDEGVEIGMNGITAHQFGHQLGLPSLFNTETGRAGIGQWGVMDMGFGNYSGLIPAEPCAWSKVFLGWEKPIEVESGTDLEVHSSLSDDPRKIYKINITSEEYYLIENRRPDYYGNGINITKSPGGVVIEADEYDADIPGPGLLIWHIDERIIKNKLEENKINTEQDRKGIYLEEADGSQDIGEVFDWILPGFPTPSNGILFDAFFRGNNDAFTPFTNPSSESNDGANSHIYITSISDTGNVMTFTIEKRFSQEGFPAFTGGKSICLSPYSADIDGDGKAEIIAVNKSGDIFAWNGEDGSTVIANDDSSVYIDMYGNRVSKKIAVFAQISKEVSMSPLAADFDNDGKKDVAVISDDGELYVWGAVDNDNNGRADLLFRVSTNTVPTSEMTAFRTDDNKLGIVFGNAKGDIIFVDIFSGMMKTFSVSNSDIKTVCYVKDGSVEGNIVAVSSSGDIIRLMITDGTTGESIYPISNPFPPGSGDLNRDGTQEVVIADSIGSILILNVEYIGAIFSPQLGYTIKEDFPFISPPSLGDIDGDGYLEILIRSEKCLHAYNYNATPVNNFPVEVEWEEINPGERCQTLVGDINGDNKPEIITGTGSGIIMAFTPDGGIIDGFPLTIGENVRATPLIDDLDGDGDIEIAAVSDDYYLYVWDFDWQYDPEKIFWGSYLKDEEHSSRVTEIYIPPIQPTEKLLVKESVYNYPNPTEDNFTTIHYFVNYAADILIKIYDLSGELVDEIQTTGQPLIDNEVTWKLDGIESGVYNAVLEAVGDGKREHKIIKIAVIK